MIFRFGVHTWTSQIYLQFLSYELFIWNLFPIDIVHRMVKHRIQLF